MRDDLRARLAAREDVLARLRGLLISSLDVKREPDEIDPDAPLFGSGLGLDSIDAVELVLLLDEHFGVKLADDTSARTAMRTVNSVVDLVVQSRAAAS
jgi:acyl carrier protein